SRSDPFRDHQQALREQLAQLLAGLPPSLVLDVECALQAEGKLLCAPSSHRPAGVWGLLTLLVAESVAPHVPPRLARSVALAVECLLCALDLLDDLEDDDQTTTLQALGPPRTLNVSTTLLLLAQRS